MPNDAGDPDASTPFRHYGATLDAVLALYHTPGLRHALRAQPVPADIGTVMRLASASQPLLDDTAARTGENPASLVEAARFYLQQVLFESGEDAYRILGVTPDAPHVRIRDHHRWLQRWLHPDHNDGGLESPFAARLNWAWNQLRTERARNAYDSQHPAAATPEPAGSAPPIPPHDHRWTTVPAPAPAGLPRWMRRGAALAALGVCALGIWLVLARQGPTPDAPPLADVESSAATPRASSATSREPPTFLPAAPSAPPPAPASAPASSNQAVATAARGAPQPDHPPPAAVAAPVPAPTHRPAAGELPTPPRLVAATSSSDAQPPQAARRARATAPIRAVPRPTHPAPTIVPRAERAAAATDSFADDPGRAASPSEAPGSATAAARPASPPPSGEALVQRVDLARARVSALVGYFRRTDSGAPDWPDAGAPFSARLQRAALRARNGLPIAATFALDAPAWTLGDAAIALRAAYRVQGSNGVAERGRLLVDMAWRDDGWQLTRVDLEPER